MSRFYYPIAQKFQKLPVFDQLTSKKTKKPPDFTVLIFSKAVRKWISSTKTEW